MSAQATIQIQVEVPGFLKKTEEDAIFAWWSNGRLLAVKGEESISFSPDDILSLRRFMGWKGDQP